MLGCVVRVELKGLGHLLVRFLTQIICAEADIKVTNQIYLQTNVIRSFLPTA